MQKHGLDRTENARDKRRRAHPAPLGLRPPLRRRRATFVGGLRLFAERGAAIGQPRGRQLALPRLQAHGACAGRERAKFNRRLTSLVRKLGVMEASRGSAEAAALSPEQAALYQRYVWASGRVELADPGREWGWEALGPSQRPRLLRWSLVRGALAFSEEGLAICSDFYIESLGSLPMPPFFGQIALLKARTSTDQAFLESLQYQTPGLGVTEMRKTLTLPPPPNCLSLGRGKG